MKYTYYLPMIEIATGSHFVLNGGWYTENEDGTMTLNCGKICKRWESFPKIKSID